MILPELNYCHTVYAGKVFHPGEHRVGLALHALSDGSKDGRWVLEEVLSWAAGLVECDDPDPSVAVDIALVTPLLTREVVDKHYVVCSLEEKEALQRLFTEAQEYWVLCDYADDNEGTDEDILLGQLSEHGGIVGFAVCWTSEGRVVEKSEEVFQHGRWGWSAPLYNNL